MSGGGLMPDAAFDLIEEAVEKLEWIRAENCTVHVATYMAASSPKPVGGNASSPTEDVPYVVVEHDGRRYRFGHIVVYDKTPLTLLEVTNGRPRYDRGWRGGDATANMYLASSPRFTDLVHDDEAEMRACGFSFARQVAAWSTELRAQIFARQINQLDERPPDIDTNDASRYLRQVADLGTYDDDGEYYARWEDHRLRRTSRKWRREVARARAEVVLDKDRPYLAVVGPFGGKVFGIVRHRGQLRLVPHLVTGPAPTLPRAEQDEARRAKYDIYFIATSDHGARRENRAMRRWASLLSSGQNASHLVVDPRHMVEASLPKQLYEKINPASDWDWFVEMVVSAFPHRLYKLSLDGAAQYTFSKNTGALHTLRRDVHWQVLQAINGIDGARPILGAARRRVLRDLEDEGWIVIPQGLRTSATTRFIGVDGAYAFERDLQSGLVYTMPIDAYLNALAEGAFAGKIFDDTEWLTYMMWGAAAIAMVAVGGWFAAGALTVQSARRVAIKLAEETLAREIRNNLIDAAKPVIYSVLALLIETVDEAALRALARLTGTQSLNDRADDLDRWQGFLLGFLDGYTVLNLQARLVALADKAMPMEARLVLFAHRVYEIAEKVRAALLLAGDELTDENTAKGILYLQQAALDFINGGVLLFGMLQHLDVDVAAGWLELFGNDHPPPSRADWERATTRSVAAVNEKMAEVASTIHDVADFLDIEDSRDTTVTRVAAVAYVGYVSGLISPAVIDLLTIPHKKWGWKGDAVEIIGALALWVIANMAASDDPASAIKQVLSPLAGGSQTPAQGPDAIDKTLDQMGKVGHVAAAVAREAFAGMFPGPSRDQAEVNGRLVGHVIGTFWVDRKMLGADSALGRRLKDKGLLGRLGMAGVTGTIGGSFVSALVKAILHRYIGVAERVSFLAGRAGSALHGMLEEDRDDHLQRLNRPELRRFVAARDSNVSLAGLIKLIARLGDASREDLRTFGQAYAGDVTHLRRTLEDGKHLLSTLGITDFAEHAAPAYALQMVATLDQAAFYFLRGFENLLKQFAGSLSWMELMMTLGMQADINVEEARATVRDALHRSLDAVRSP